jgi:hypothetical protein
MAYEPLPVEKKASDANPYAAPAPIAEVAPPANDTIEEIPSVVLDELQRVANFREMCKRLRKSSVGNLVFGAIALAAGIPLMHRYPLNTV